MHDYPLVAKILSHFGANSSNELTGVANWPRSSRRESKQSAQGFLDVVVMVHLSCFVVFFVSTQHFAAMELGQSVSIIAGKYAGKVWVERWPIRNVTVKSTARHYCQFPSVSLLHFWIQFVALGLRAPVRLLWPFADVFPWKLRREQTKEGPDQCLRHIGRQLCEQRPKSWFTHS